ncbi:MAG: hypothetical protein F6K18_01495 [Okeania sp. SIO2C2]|uniref:hypothetical protein n=1 Tax=Okeania sp. SIO2C2 TaxID=2607787 RepID=UPI0013BE7E46|nr:hypothetical protein [Okeania sp. SIO2C2]NEP85604.1 hypothetical protein [Okeania sp. SIO2C2]
MANCLGYYGSSDEATRNLNYDGTAPEVTDEQRQAIEKAVAEVIPEIKDLNSRDKRAVVKWVVNEGY